MLDGNNLKILIILILLIIFIAVWIILTLHTIKLKKRVDNFVINKNLNDDISILGKLEKKYFKVRKRLVKYLKKKTKIKDEDNIILTCDKLLVSLITVIIYLIISFITFTVPSLLLIVFFLMLGYLLPTFKIMIMNRINKKLIEKDLLKAISLINNCLQSGKSIFQAIKTVSIELDGPIATQFEKIEKDLEKGLSLTDSFNRFEERVKLEEVDYITTSLLILNQTGGDMVSVFKSLEESFYTRRMLASELKATIASSKLVFYVLVSLPFIIYMLIGLTNPTYFIVFFKSQIGILLLILILLIYTLYVIIIRNIMKVEKY